MNRRELAKAVAVQADVDLKTVLHVLEKFTEVVTGVVSKGETISIPGFVRFVKVDRPARMGRNPATGEQMMFKASKKVRVSAAKAFRDAVMAPSKAPKLARGAYPVMEEYVKKAGKAVAAAPAKATAKKAPAKKAAARRAPARKAAPAKRTTARKAPAKKAPAKRTAAKKTTKRAPARRR